MVKKEHDGIRSFRKTPQWIKDRRVAALREWFQDNEVAELRLMPLWWLRDNKIIQHRKNEVKQIMAERNYTKAEAIGYAHNKFIVNNRVVVSDYLQYYKYDWTEK